MGDKEQARTLTGTAHIRPVEASAEGDSEIERLRAELAEERERRIVAEAIAEERERALEDVRLALRAIAAVDPATAQEPEPEVTSLLADQRSRPRGNWLH